MLIMKMDYEKLAELLFPNVKKDIDFWFLKYPKRKLLKGSEVTRIAPSPTGYLHIGHIYQALIDKRLANSTGGVFYIRLEDTDQLREIENAGQIAYDMLNYYGMTSDEGYRGNAPQIGNYQSYIQSERGEIYHTFVKKLISKGKAFPCFCEKASGKHEVLERREQQLEENDGLEDRDVCRNLTFSEIEKNIKEGKPFAVRLKSEGDINKTFKFYDLIKGEREVRENIKDIVLLKSNGTPPYALAHMVDDTLMGTTIVVRGEEWYPSLSAHLEVFKALDLPYLKYAHTPVICKLDQTNNKRKLSKRKDPEADARFFIEKGYPVQSLIEYILNLANSNFEPWREKNPLLHYNEFPFSISKIGSNNPMFDFVKLDDTSKNVISRFSAQKIYDETLVWAKNYNTDFFNIIKDKKEFAESIFNIDRNSQKPRKDIAKWSDIPILYEYMFEELFTYNLSDYEFENNIDNEDIKKILIGFLSIYDQMDEKQEWFDKIRGLCEPLGFSADMKVYKQNPNNFKGSVATLSGIIRVAITKRKNTPDLYFICKLLGEKTLRKRLNFVINNI